MEPIRLSFGARIAALQLGETVAEARRFGLDGLIGRQDVQLAIEQMRNIANPAVKAAKDKFGGEYVVESGSFLTRSRDMMIVVTVTRSD